MNEIEWINFLMEIGINSEVIEIIKWLQTEIFEN